MLKFTYKAKTLDGRTVTGLVEATNQEEALKLLHEKKLVIFFLKEKVKKSLFGFLTSWRGVTQKDISELTRQLATMVNAGLTLTASLNILQDQAKPGMLKILTALSRKIEGGASFYSALTLYPKHFSPVYLSLIKSGEAAGKLDRILKELADSLDKQEGFKRKVIGALIYPAIIVGGMIVVSFIMMIFVIPKLTGMYESMEVTLPTPTQILISVSTYMAKFWYLLILAGAGLVYAFNKWRKTVKGREITDTFVLRIPIVGKLMTKIVLAQMTRTLSMLITAGVPIIEGLNIVAEAASNAVFKISVQKSAQEVEKGIALSAALQKHEEYPPVVIQMISVGEQTGKLGEVLIRVANYFESESEEAIKGLTTAIEPLMMIILGIGVAFIVISVITPIYNLTSQF